MLDARQTAGFRDKDRGGEGEYVILGLGSNKSHDSMDSRKILGQLMPALGELLREMRISSFYETEPLYVTDQPVFVNAAAAGFYPASPRELLEAARQLEIRFGRDRARERRWGERSLDIDILLFGSLIISEPPVLEIPHPRLKERRFALEPLLELVPGALEPGTGIAYSQICGSLPDQGVKKLAASWQADQTKSMDMGNYRKRNLTTEDRNLRFPGVTRRN
jgi:2-amino-4-hydroxy-6-hydroxymethyldihydropteridine diphosphokinase